jgi:hypothetical protein
MTGTSPETAEKGQCAGFVSVIIIITRYSRIPDAFSEAGRYIPGSFEPSPPGPFVGDSIALEDLAPYDKRICCGTVIP